MCGDARRSVTWRLPDDFFDKAKGAASGSSDPRLAERCRRLSFFLQGASEQNLTSFLEGALFPLRLISRVEGADGPGPPRCRSGG